MEPPKMDEDLNYTKDLRQFIIDQFLFGDGEGLTEETSFLESGIVDSTGILEIVSFIEETYGIIIDDEDLLPENLDCLKNLSVFLSGKLQGRAGGAGQG